MASMNQPDLFASPAQSDLFAAERAAERDHRPDPERVRAKLAALLAQAQAADAMPWSRSKTKLYRTIFPQMSLWLPDEEAEQLRLEFEREMERLEA